ncbi:MAG TPA: hypothetical protein VHQ00_07705, partial [Chloroflexota bacterium]|nr:hypothetical protein [Chloroflexota bacterium]
TLLQEGDRYVRRHSYADQLRYGDSPGISAGGAAGGPAGGPAGGAPGGRPRPYDFLFQLWNLGTNRLLLWADPQWVRRFAASSTLAGATGFEVCAPLSHKGFGNRGGAWSIFADPSLRHYRWEQERYWPWYLLFGRLGYHGDASPDVWRREWAARFGREAAPHLERALQAASGVLPLLTARHSPSASVFGYWPEKDMGGLLDLYLQVPASDVAMFASAQEVAAARLGGTPDARQTPEESGAIFSRFASEAEGALERALATATPATESAARELRGVALDVRVQATLARYHAAKLSAATHLAAFYAAGDLDSLLAARPPAAEALAAWEQLVRLTDGVYQDDLIFGRPDDQDGHWKDNLPYARHDLQRLDEVEALWRRYGHFDLGFDFGAQLPPRTGTPPLPYLHDYPTERRFLPVGPQTLYSPHTGYGWGGTYGLLATAFPRIDGKTLRASAPHPTVLPTRPAGSTPHPTVLPTQALYADFVHRHPAAGYDNATFLVDLPNGDYEVTVVLADRSPDPTDHGPLTLRLQGRHELGPIPVPAGEIVERRQRVQVSAGRLDVEVSAPPQGDWLLTALLVTRVAPHIGHLPPPCARPARPLPLRATVSGPEPLRAVAVRYRYGADGPFQTLPLAPVPEPDAPATGAPPGPRYVVELTPPAEATLCEYYLEAEDVQGTRVTWPPSGPLGPRRLHVGEAGSPPRIAHSPPPPATPGQPLPIRARVSAGAPLARVTLHYRNLNQMQTHDLLPLLPEPEPAGGLAPAAGE